MLSTQIGNVNVHFEPLIAVAILFGAILLFHIIRTIILEIKCNQISKDILAGNYDDIIKSGEKVLKIYKKNHSKLSTKVLAAKIESLNFALAVSYFAKSNDNLFLEHINDLKQNNSTKAFWLALFYLQKEDFETAKTLYDEIESCDKNHTIITFLDSYLSYKQGNLTMAREKMAEIHSTLNHVVLKQIADEILK